MFYISASALNNYFTCPARFEFSRRLRPKKESKALVDGSTAHAILAGESPFPISPRARSFADRLKLLYNLNYKHAWLDEDRNPVTEVKQRFAPARGVRLTRIIDAFGLDRDTGEPVLIDYKTGTYPYKGEDGVVPQSMGFQAAAYVMPTEEEVWTPWPERIDFLHAPERGAGAIYTYRRNKEDEENLLIAIETVKSAKSFPKHRGYHCSYCPFFSACFQTEGWEEEYEEYGKS